MSDFKVVKLSLQKFLPYRLSVLANRVSQTWASLHNEGSQLSTAEWRVLAVLGEESNLSGVDICKKTAMDKVAVSRAVTKLLQKGSLSKLIDGKDNRRFVLSLSDTGKTLYQQLVPMALKYEQKLLSKLSRQEQQDLKQLLDKLDLAHINISKF